MLIIGLSLIYCSLAMQLTGPPLFLGILAGFYFLGSAKEVMERQELRKEQLEYFARANQEAKEETTDIICPHCNATNAGTSVFCNQCGQALKKQEE